MYLDCVIYLEVDRGHLSYPRDVREELTHRVWRKYWIQYKAEKEEKEGGRKYDKTIMKAKERKTYFLKHHINT